MDQNYPQIASGKWIQKVTWNRSQWVTTREREQPHKTPVTSTWTADFLPREGKDLKAMGDWLRDKTISWKTRRSLLHVFHEIVLSLIQSPIVSYRHYTSSYRHSKLLLLSEMGAVLPFSPRTTDNT